MAESATEAPSWPRLLEYLRETLGSEALEFAPPELLGGGAIQQNFALRLRGGSGPLEGEQDLVLRTDAPSGVSGSLDRGREFEVLQAAFDAGVMVPEPMLLCKDTAVIGRPFYLMRRVGGTAAGHRLVRMRWSDDARERLAFQLGVELGKLHRVSPPFPGLENLTELDMSPSRFRIQTYRIYLDELRVPQPTLEWALRWLERHAPQHEDVVLCHGDFRTGNFMVDGERLSGILDWEFAGWSEPLEDLGWLCARCWRFGAFDYEVGGIGGKTALLEGYRSAREVELDAEGILYWEVMALVRWAVIALQQGARHTSGREPSLELALTGRMLPEMELDILDQIERLEHR